MPRAPALTPDESQRVVAALRELLAQCAGSQSEMQRRWPGLKQRQVSKVLRGQAEPGWDYARKVAKALGRDTEHLLSGAVGSRERVVRDDRYPNRGKAMDAARMLGIDARAIDAVSGMELKSATDPDPESWLDEIRSFARRLRMEAVDPKAVVKEAERSRAEVDELTAATTPKLPSKKK